MFGEHSEGKVPLGREFGRLEAAFSQGSTGFISVLIEIETLPGRCLV